MAAAERIPVLVTAAQKALITRKARNAKLTVGEFMRQAAEAYEPGEEDAGLVALIERVKRSTAEASAALDAVLKRCAESDRRIEKMQAAHRSKSKP